MKNETYEKDGIIFYVDPFITAALEWMDNHVGCNAVADKTPEYGMIAVRAYAKDKTYNPAIFKLHRSLPGTELVIGTAETEVSAID